MISSFWVESVQETVARLVACGYPTIEQTARALGCSPRTLQRRFHDAGTSYGEVVDRVRADAAIRMLEDPSLRLYEIGAALGFADPSSFSRFFRRIRGVAPREVRPGRPR